MKVHIYQIDLSQESNIRVCFMPYDDFMKASAGSIPAEIYKRVYSMDQDTEDPEAIYTLLNLDRPADYAARSLSVSDIVEFEKDDGSRVFYYCDTFGFKEISFDRNAIPDHAE